MKIIKCPYCGERIAPQEVGYTTPEGEWELEYVECPICNHILTARDLAKDLKIKK